jgi:lisH domain-containing protein FOPNL
VQKPPLPKENLIINELIREYLTYNNYNHALSVFLSESGQPSEPPFSRLIFSFIFDCFSLIFLRDFLSKELRVYEDHTTRDVPLLYGLMFGLQKDKPVHPTQTYPKPILKGIKLIKNKQYY